MLSSSSGITLNKFGISWIVWNIIYLALFVLHCTWKDGNGFKCLKTKKKTCCFTSTGFRIHWNLCDYLYPFPRSIGKTIKKELDHEWQNRMADICYHKPAIITSHGEVKWNGWHMLCKTVITALVFQVSHNSIGFSMIFKKFVMQCYH